MNLRRQNIGERDIQAHIFPWWEIRPEAPHHWEPPAHSSPAPSCSWAWAWREPPAPAQCQAEPQRQEQVPCVAQVGRDRKYRHHRQQLRRRAAEERSRPAGLEVPRAGRQATSVTGEPPGPDVVVDDAAEPPPADAAAAAEAPASVCPDCSRRTTRQRSTPGNVPPGRKEAT